jgi:hypothetical protein
MLYFLAGIITGVIMGLIIAALIFVIVSFFRNKIEEKINPLRISLENAGPKPAGAIFIPEDESDIVRKEYIEQNRREGKDTHISELL